MSIGAPRSGRNGTAATSPASRDDFFLFPYSHSAPGSGTDGGRARPPPPPRPGRRRRRRNTMAGFSTPHQRLSP
jgi:hypothetical protein